MTVLAIVETIAASTISVYLALRIGNLFYLVVGASLAPVLLTRTECSDESITSLGKQYIDLFLKLSSSNNRYLFACGYLMVVLFIPFIVVVKALVTLWMFIRQLPVSLNVIPSNWYRVCLTTDSARAPELFPRPDNWDHLKYPFDLHALIRKICIRSDAVWYSQPIGVLFAVCICFPSWVYRWSLKSTAFAYLPLIYVVRSNLLSRDKVVDKIGDVLDDPLERLSLWYSWFVLIGLNIVPVFIIFQAYSIKDKYAPSFDLFFSSKLSPILAYRALKVFAWLTPGSIEIGLWHITRLLGALLTFWLYVFAKRAKRKVSRRVWSELWAEQVIANLSVVRGLLGLFTAICSVVVLVHAVDWSQLPPFILRWFPS